MMYVKLYYNYERDTNERRTALKRGYKPHDKLVEGWDGYVTVSKINVDTINSIVDIITIQKISGIPTLAIERGDVIYCPSMKRAYARTLSSWKLIRGFMKPVTPSTLVRNSSTEGEE